MAPHRFRSLTASTVAFISLSCAQRSAPAPAAPVFLEGPQAVVFEAPPIARGPVNPYAPKRSPSSPEYSWQNATPVRCGTDLPSAAEPAVLEAKLSFDDSLGALPATNHDEASAVPGQLAQDAPDTWGTGAPLAAEADTDHRLSNPELVVAALRPRFHSCFSRWLEAKADAQGSVHFALELGCAGQVQSISAAVQGVDEPTLECLFAVVAPAQFDPPPTGHARIQVPVVFKNAAR